MAQDSGTGGQEKSASDMTPDEARAELAKREADKVTRRAALAKVGMRTGMAIFAAFSVDDLAQKTATVLSQRSQDNAVVEKMTRELRGAGVAFAAHDPDPDPAPSGCETASSHKIDCLTRSLNDYLDCTNVNTDAYCLCEKAKRDRICRCNYHNACVGDPSCACGQTDCPPEPTC